MMDAWRCISRCNSRCISIFLLLALAPLQAPAQSWPDRTVRIIVPNAPGSSPDILTRLVADRLTRTFGRSFVIENNVAGAGLVAAQLAARAAPDGYTLHLGSVLTFATNRHMFKSLGYDPDRDFLPVALLYGGGALGIMVHPELPVKTVQDLIALARAQPGKLSWATQGNLGGIVAAWFIRATGTDIVLVPYKSPALSQQDTAAGRTQVLIDSLIASEAFRKSGKLRVLAMTGDRRFPGLDEVPTVQETIPGFRASGWGLLVAPAGTPADIRQRLNLEIDQQMREPEFAKRLLGYGFNITGAGTLESIAEFVRAERELWDRIMKEVGVQPQ